MTLKDISNGPDWVIWVVLVIFVLLTICLLTGHGENLISGYNTASQKEKDKYNTKKLCRVEGIGMLVITICIFVMAFGENILPAITAYVFLGIIVVDCAAMIILGNTICKKRIINRA